MRSHGRGFRIVATLVIITFVHLMMASTSIAQPAGGGSDEQTESTGLQYGYGTASVFASIPYGLGKFLFATLGGIIGGFTWAFSGGNTKAAKSVWDTSVRGTYVITPEHLKGEKSVRFLGVPSEAEGTAEPAPEPSAEPSPTEPTK